MRLIRPLALGALAALGVSPAMAQKADLSCKPDSVARLDVHVSGLKQETGLVAVSLYSDDPKRFLKHNGSIGTVRATARAPSTHVCIALPRPGRYAVAVYHDVNGDRKLNRNFLLPAEPFALSNNPPPRMAWPALEPSLFSTHEGENSISVSLNKGRTEAEGRAAPKG